MQKIKLFKVENKDLEITINNFFNDIKKNQTVYYTLLNNGFNDQNIIDNIGPCYKFYNDFLKWEKIKTIEDCKRYKIKYKYDIFYNKFEKDVYYEYSLLEPIENLTIYNNAFLFKDFDEEYINASFNNVSKTNPNFAKKMLLYYNNNESFIIHGAINTGKTYSVVSLINEVMIENKRKIAYINSPKRISQLNNLMFQNKMRFAKNLEEIMKIDVLILDDFSSIYFNEFIRDNIIIPLFEYRLKNKLLTVLILDISYNELISLFENKENSQIKIKTKQLNNILISLFKNNILLTSTKPIY
ncbi:MAG: ATP-binding protein [Bacillales bacterium]